MTDTRHPTFNDVVLTTNAAFDCPSCGEHGFFVYGLADRASEVMGATLTVDFAADAAYLRLSDKPVARTGEVDTGVLVDLDEFGMVVGVEVLELDVVIPRTDTETLVHPVRSLLPESEFHDTPVYDATPYYCVSCYALVSGAW